MKTDAFGLAEQPEWVQEEQSMGPRKGYRPLDILTMVDVNVELKSSSEYVDAQGRGLSSSTTLVHPRFDREVMQKDPWIPGRGRQRVEVLWAHCWGRD